MYNKKCITEVYVEVMKFGSENNETSQEDPVPPWLPRAITEVWDGLVKFGRENNET